MKGAGHEHPFTHAGPGGWCWTPLAGGVPDADDTAGALLALHRLDAGNDDATCDAAAAGIAWLLDLQNRDGGIPTFCRGWGKLPFDRSCPDLTAHAVRAFAVWLPEMPPRLQERIRRGLARGLAYLARSQRRDGAWLPLWFGNQAAPRHENPTYGTAQVLVALRDLQFNDPSLALSSTGKLVETGERWLLAAQNPDGGWGGAPGVPSSIEETCLALAALADSSTVKREVLSRGIEWLAARFQTDPELTPAPIGLYFASLWYSERMYPLVFAALALERLRRKAQPQRRATVHAYEDATMKLTIQVDRETDGRWLAEIPELPGVMAYGQTRGEALRFGEALALRVISDRLEHDESVPESLTLGFAVA